MSIITIVRCDFCGRKLELADKGETIGAESILEVNDAMQQKVHFCGVAHLREWAKTYTCPYRKSVSTAARPPRRREEI